MKIVEDSMKILAFIYKEGKTNGLKIMGESNFNIMEVNRRLDFLVEEDLIKFQFQDGAGTKKGIECTSKGIILIESPKESIDRKDALINLNINIDSIFKADFESLIKLDSLFKGSLFGI